MGNLNSKHLPVHIYNLRRGQHDQVADSNFGLLYGHYILCSFQFNKFNNLTNAVLVGLR